MRKERDYDEDDDDGDEDATDAETALLQKGTGDNTLGPADVQILELGRPSKNSVVVEMLPSTNDEESYDLAYSRFPFEDGNLESPGAGTRAPKGNNLDQANEGGGGLWDVILSPFGGRSKVDNVKNDEAKAKRYILQEEKVPTDLDPSVISEPSSSQIFRRPCPLSRPPAYRTNHAAFLFHPSIAPIQTLHCLAPISKYFSECEVCCELLPCAAFPEFCYRDFFVGAESGQVRTMVL